MSHGQFSATPSRGENALAEGNPTRALLGGLTLDDTPLGPFETWPPALRVAFQMIEASSFPMFITWGDSFPYLYNSACRPIVGARHPEGFGRPFQKVWPEVWPELQPLLAAAMAGTTSYREKLPLALVRNGVMEQCWFTFSYSPLYDEAGVVRGVVSVAVEDTVNIVAARRADLRSRIDATLVSTAQAGDMTAAVDSLVIDYFEAETCSFRDLAGGTTATLADLSDDEKAGLVSGRPVMRSAAPATLMVPLMRSGTAASIVEVRVAGTRHWSSDDVAAVRESMEQLRAARQKRAAEAAARRNYDELRRLADALPVLISYVDADERYRFGNRAYESWFGLRGEEIVGKKVVEVVGEAAYLRLAPILARVMAGEGGVAESIIPYRSGGERHVQITYVPRRDGTGTVQGYYALVQDIGDQKRAEAALRQSELRLSQVLESVSDGFFALDADWRFSVFNRACEVAFETSREDVIGKTIWDVFPTTRQPGFEGRLRAVAEHEVPDRFEADSVVTPGGLVEIRAAPKEGGGVAVAFSDITQRKRAEDHRQLLVNELNHRVKNTLAVVQAIASQSFKPGAEMEAARNAFEGRLATLAEAHNLLTEKNWQDAQLLDVVESAISAAAERRRFTLSGPAVSLMPQTAVSLALAVHELCTNAVKYGSLSVAGGKVAINWSVGPDAAGALRLRFIWSECDGPEVALPASRGFGSRLLEKGLARELRGNVRLDFDPEGLSCRIDAPLPMAG